MKTSKAVRWVMGLAIVSVVLLATAYFGRKGYRSWRQERLVSQAKDALAQGEQRNAQLLLGRALAIKPSDLEAIRLMASMADYEKSPMALVWRQRAVEVAPDSPEDRLAFAQTAASFKQFRTATNNLLAVEANAQATPRFHSVSGNISAMMGDQLGAERHFVEAARLDPSDPVTQLNLAVVRLGSTNGPTLESAKVALESLASKATNAGLRVRAKRELVGLAVRQGQTNAAARLADDLVHDPGATFSDRLVRLDALGRTRNPAFQEALFATRSIATNKASTVADMLLWELSKVPGPRTMEWFLSLPTEFSTNAAVALVAADLRRSVGDWTGLTTTLETQNWGDLDFLRFAYRTLGLRAQKLTTAADAEWGQALKGAAATKVTMSILLDNVTKWQWPNEMRDILNMMVGRFPNDTWASDLLIQNLYSEGQSRPLLALFRQLAAARPADLQVRNNLAMTALLLEATELKPHDIAREVFQAAPTNSHFASTYAFSLHLQEKNAEALEIMNKFPKDLLKDPALAGYYGLILKATGKATEARAYLELATKARLLPEEKAIFERALRGG